MISDDEIASLMTAEDFVASCDEAFRLYGTGDMLNPAREESLTQDGDMDVFRLTLPGEWVGKFRGKKEIEERSDIKTGRLGDRHAFIELEDLNGGQIIRFDAEHITNMRTGAAGVLGAKYLSSLPIQKVAILGTGRIAEALALCAEVALSPAVVCVTSRKQENREAFVARLGPQMSCEVTSASSVALAVSDADVILAGVPTPEPILLQNMVSDLAHLSVLGGDQRTQQLDTKLFLQRLIVPDHPEQVLKSGDFLGAQKAQEEISWAREGDNKIYHIGHAALGHLENLRGTGVIVYFSGMAIQDVHAASVAWGRYRALKM